MNVTFEDLESITTSVFASMLEYELALDPSVASKTVMEASHVGLIRLDGAFHGAVAVHLVEDLVRGAASVMFAFPAEEVNEEQMFDTVAELTNMIGGNVKCLVEQPSQLSLPKVLDRKAAERHIQGASKQAEVGFSGQDGGCLVVSVHEGTAPS